MVGWHHQLNGHESEQTPGDSERQERGHKETRDLTTGQQQQQRASVSLNSLTKAKN